MVLTDQQIREHRDAIWDEANKNRLRQSARRWWWEWFMCDVCWGWY